ncbi:MAG: AMP-binding protein [Ruminococcus sp.]|nr:AMP-binding protein [Ruminococcus sp.]
MAFWQDELKELEASGRSFADIYRIMKSRFSSEIFSEEYRDGDTIRTTYSELFAGAESVAKGLSDLYPDSFGCFIAIRMDNSPLWVECFFGALMAGLRPVLINTRLNEPSVEYTLSVTNALCVLCDNDTDKEKYINANNFKKAEFVPARWADEIVLMSSGTTGTPKLVVYDGGAVCEQILVSGWVVKQNPTIKHDRKLQIRLIALLPFYHIFGLSTTLMWFGFFGRTLIFPPSMDSESIQFACKVGKATHFFAIPLVWNTAMKKLLSEAKRQGQEEKLRKGIRISNALQSVFPRFGAYVARNILFKDVRRQVFGNTLEFCISGGGFISSETVEMMNGLGYSLYCGYGMTETGITSVDLSMKASLRNENTVGRPFPTVEYKFSDKGTLLVKGGTLCSAFVDKEGEHRRNKEDFFDTGDMCTVDKRGRWVLFGRQDDVIIGESGENLSPDMIEQQLDIKCSGTVCVLGLDIEGSVRPALVVGVSKNTGSYELAKLAEKIYSAIESLPITMRPARVLCTTDEIPENLGKVKRASLKKLIENGEVSVSELQRVQADSLAQVYGESVAQIIEGVKKCFAQVLSKNLAEIEDTAHFIYDLGGESMSYFTLFSLINNTYGTQLKMEQSNPLFTPLDFAKEIAKGGN